MNHTLKYVKILESAGISREQAEAHVQLITEITEGDLATKQDIQNLELTTKQGLRSLEVATKQDIQNLELTTKQGLRSLEVATKQDIQNLATDTKQEMRALGQDFKDLETKLEMSVERLEHKMLQLESRLIIKVGTIVTVVVAAATAAAKLLK